MDIDERQLVTRAQEGDRKAFEALVRQYQRRVFRVAMGMLRNEEDALEVAQEAFVKAHQNLGRFKGDSAFYTWMHRITSNLCIDLLRRRRGEAVEYDDSVLRESPESEATDLSPSGIVAPGKAALDKELGQKLQSSLDCLSDAHRQILVLREIEGLSYEEIARVLGIKKGTVMSRLFHARKNMQSRLRSYLTSEELAELTGEEPAGFSEAEEASVNHRNQASGQGGGGSRSKSGVSTSSSIVGGPKKSGVREGAG